MNSKKRDKAIRVWVNSEEKEQIETTLQYVDSWSTSSFLRTLGLCHESKSTIDKQSVLALAKINADQGRLGGLLKMLLSNNQYINTESSDKADALLDEIKEVQAMLLSHVKRLLLIIMSPTRLQLQSIQYPDIG